MQKKKEKRKKSGGTQQGSYEEHVREGTGRGRGKRREKTYPRMVRQMLMSRSAPQPATQ